MLRINHEQHWWACTPQHAGALWLAKESLMEWEVETMARLLTLIGGQETPEAFKRAQALFEEFKYHFPDAKAKWDAYCEARGV